MECHELKQVLFVLAPSLAVLRPYLQNWWSKRTNIITQHTVRHSHNTHHIRSLYIYFSNKFTYATNMFNFRLTSSLLFVPDIIISQIFSDPSWSLYSYQALLLLHTIWSWPLPVNLLSYYCLYLPLSVLLLATPYDHMFMYVGLFDQSAVVFHVFMLFFMF